MCGIHAILNYQSTDDDLQHEMNNASHKLSHRGPDWSGMVYSSQLNLNDSWKLGKFAIGHERLAIIDVFNGAQPIQHDGIILSVNGEIYNYKQLIEEYNDVFDEPYDPETGSDCEIILHLYKQGLNAKTILNKLSGDFAFILIDTIKNKVLIARDIIGVNPLYYAYSNIDIQSPRDTSRDTSHDTSHTISISSEMKTLGKFDTVKVFPPGHFMEITNVNSIPTPTPYYSYPWCSWQDSKIDLPNVSDEMFDTVINANTLLMQDNLIEAVHKRMMTDVPFGVFLSGGLDSSVIAAIAQRLCKLKDPYDRIKTFSIGLKDGNSPDKEAAEKVAKHIGSDHYHFEFTLQEAYQQLNRLIQHLETYDVTTIRASMPMFLLSRRVKSLGVKMVLSGEGSDEIFGGYLYFHNAPTILDFKKETVDRVRNLHVSDCLRANKSTMAWGLEVRVPFLDRQFLEFAMNIHPSLLTPYPGVNRRFMEKWLLRLSFDRQYSGIAYLPDDVTWRQKEQFSDGVGYGWIDSIAPRSESYVNNIKSSKGEEYVDTIYKKFNTCSSNGTAEQFMYYDIWTKTFSSNMEDTVVPWIPKWCESSDPSGRSQAIHNHHS